MMSDWCIMSPSMLVPTLRVILNELALNDPDRRLKFLKEEGLVAVPIKCSSPADDIKEALRDKIDCNDLEIRHINLPIAKRLTVKSPQRILGERLKHLVIDSGQEWTEAVSKDVPDHWELHGDLVLVPDTAFILPVWDVIGSDVWRTVVECLSCKRVARKSKVSIDGYRTPQVHLLHGEHGWVEHTDNGIRYTYDVTKCMFSVGNITEKLRIANFKCRGEIVVDLYAGIGYFALAYLVHTGVKHLHACEWNQYAVEALRRNLALNGVQDRCTVYAGDNRELCPKGIADRVNLGLIPSSREGWRVACAALKPGTGGMLHIHYNVNTKPRTRNQNEVDQESSEPADVFRCEAKCQKSLDRNTFKMECERSRTGECESSRTGECESSRTGECESSRTGECGSSRTGECESSRAEVFERSSVTEWKGACSNGSNKAGCSINNVPNESLGAQTENNIVCNNVEKSKWYCWAKTTSNEIRDILENIHNGEWTTGIVHIEHVKSYAPYINHVVLDLECRPRT